MNLLIINASPRHGGNIDRIICAMKDKAEKETDFNVEYVRTSDLQIASCCGCMSCRTSNKCVLPEDDAQRVLEKIKWCDALIVGAPCYWGNIPGTLKLLFDRIVYGMMGETRLGIPRPLHKGKKAVVIATSTTVWPFNILAHQTSGVKRALKEILGYSGFKIVKTIQKGGTKNSKPISGKKLETYANAIYKLR